MICLDGFESFILRTVDNLLYNTFYVYCVVTRKFSRIYVPGKYNKRRLQPHRSVQSIWTIVGVESQTLTTLLLWVEYISRLFNSDGSLLRDGAIMSLPTNSDAQCYLLYLVHCIDVNSLSTYSWYGIHGVSWTRICGMSLILWHRHTNLGVCPMKCSWKPCENLHVWLSIFNVHHMLHAMQKHVQVLIFGAPSRRYTMKTIPAHLHGFGSEGNDAGTYLHLLKRYILRLMPRITN